MYFVILTQQRNVPIPIKSSSDARGTGPRNRLITAPVIWKMFETRMMMDQ